MAKIKKNSSDALTVDECKMIGRLLKKHNTSSIYFDIWTFGLNVPWRISDLLLIEYQDIFEAQDDLGQLCYWVRRKEKKTGKYSLVKLNSVALSVIESRKQQWPEDQYLFQVHSNRANLKPISRIAVYRAFEIAGERIARNVGCHSTRKSRGKMLYDSGVPIEHISKVLNHSSPSETMRYIGLDQKTIDDTYSLEMLSL